MKALAVRMEGEHARNSEPTAIDRDLIERHVQRIEVRKRHLAVQFRDTETDTADRGHGVEGSSLSLDSVKNASLLLVDWHKPPAKRFREILLPPSVPRRDVRVIKAERRAALIKSIARGRQWLDELITGSVTGVDELAARHRCSVRHVNMTISLAFLAPNLVKAAVEGRLPRGIGVARLRDAPAEWPRQFERLGLASPY